MKPIQLNGSNGGGQMLRTALSLSMITGQAFRMVNIRGQRQKPGLMRQHLTCVKAACEISNGTVDGAEMGSTEIVFQAGEIQGGSYEFAIGTAGSTSLLYQTLFPALLHANEDSELTLKGGTHNPLAPPFEYLDHVFLPALQRMGISTSLNLLETGFTPIGGGVIQANIAPSHGFDSMEWHERGEPSEHKILIPYRDLRQDIPERVAKAAQTAMPDADCHLNELQSGKGPGIACMIESSFTNAASLSTIYGAKNMSSERVGKNAVKNMQTFIGCDVPVDRHLADQLLLPMALAGEGSFTTMHLDNHVPSNISVIEQFLPVKFHILDKGKKQVISVSEN